MIRHTVPPQPADDWISRAGAPDDREDPADEAAERLAKDCKLAAQCLRDTGTFRSGQGVLDAAAALIRAQAAEIARLAPPPAEPAGDALREALQRLDAELQDHGYARSGTMRKLVRAALAAAPAPIQPALPMFYDDEAAKAKSSCQCDRIDPQPDADEREAMVEVIREAEGDWLDDDNDSREPIIVYADALLAAGWTRKREEGA